MRTIRSSCAITRTRAGAPARPSSWKDLHGICRQNCRRVNQGWLLDARVRVCVQGAGVGSAAHGAGVAPDCTSARVPKRAKTLSLSAEKRLALRQRISQRLIRKLHKYLLQLQQTVSTKSAPGVAVRYALNHLRREWRPSPSQRMRLSAAPEAANVVRANPVAGHHRHLAGEFAGLAQSIHDLVDSRP